MARPSRTESVRRTRDFARLVAADPSALEQHAKQVGIDPWRALRLLSDPHFRVLVAASENGGNQ